MCVVCVASVYKCVLFTVAGFAKCPLSSASQVYVGEIFMKRSNVPRSVKFSKS